LRKIDYDFSKDVVCSDTDVCSDKILSGLEIKTGYKLHANTKTEIGIEGSLSILHEQNNHLILIQIYLETKDRFKEVLNAPSKDQMNKTLIEVLSEESKKPNRVLAFIKKLIP